MAGIADSMMGAWRWFVRAGARHSLSGIAIAVVFGCLAFTPSLLPRPWWLQGLVDGFSALCGYVIGAFLGWLVARLTGREPIGDLRERMFRLIFLTAVPMVVASMWFGQQWQREIHLRMGLPAPDSNAWLPILIVALGLLILLVEFGRAVGWFWLVVDNRLRRRLPQRLAAPMAVLLVGALLVLVNNGLVVRLAVAMANSTFAAANTATTPGYSAPVRAERSGGPGSLISWESLGQQGRDFIATGPSVWKLKQYWGSGIDRPIRVYAGLDSADSVRQRAQLAVAELRRAGGFDREVLVVAGTTGTGWVDPGSVDAIEYMYRGDTAIVAMQYSYLPSWISFLVDQEPARVSGRELFNQVYEAWAELPADQRPKLLVTGTSLGGFGTEAAFGGLADLRLRTDGVLWAGPPRESEFHSSLVAQRDPGSLERMPVFGGGEKVRFAAGDGRVDATGEWQQPRVLYLQNGSDPIIYWQPELAWQRPDWLTEPLPPEVLPQMTWIPLVTFWQVSADLPYSFDMPSGFGHSYHDAFTAGWAAVAPPAGWTDADTARLSAHLAR